MHKSHFHKLFFPSVITFWYQIKKRLLDKILDAMSMHQGIGCNIKKKKKSVDFSTVEITAFWIANFRSKEKLCLYLKAKRLNIEVCLAPSSPSWRTRGRRICTTGFWQDCSDRFSLPQSGSVYTTPWSSSTPADQKVCSNLSFFNKSNTNF